MNAFLRYLGDQSSETEVNGLEFDFLTTSAPESGRHNRHQPPALNMVLVAPPSNVVILALDLSDTAIAQVSNTVVLLLQKYTVHYSFFGNDTGPSLPSVVCRTLLYISHLSVYDS